MGFYGGQLTLRKIVNHNIAIPAVFMSMQREKKINKNGSEKESNSHMRISLL